MRFLFLALSILLVSCADRAVLPDGKYTIKSMIYDDYHGDYSLFLLGAPSNIPSPLHVEDLAMAESTTGTSYLEVAKNSVVAHIPKDFAITFQHTTQVGGGLVHENSTWSPFMASMAGTMVGNALSDNRAPRYYAPPPYSQGPITGYGSVGRTRTELSTSYSSKFGKSISVAPRSSSFRSSSSGSFGSSAKPSTTFKPSGGGAGSTKLSPTPSSTSRPSSSPSRSFGGGGFGGGRRR